ncbi:hypothetical protein G9C85_15825 [Halorubellus sp. JP-L1]|uniref:DUF7269 family protein n=1 Tax=Halorubellus sp. JP-L1 TaxID=2715753 RepID=UPI00140DF428|nr:hypothetical protein [Halorubellus sp. JP-L1]NHN43086.1 hypothetical protein [Halorubellus sp. JP-L1]
MGLDDLRDAGDRRTVRRLVAGVGVLALSLAVLSALVPAVGDAVAGSLGASFGNPVLVVLASVVGGVYGLAHLYLTGTRESTAAPLVGREPERAHYAENHVSGEEIDQSVETVGGELPESAAKNWWTYREKNDVTSTLTELAVRVLANEHDVDGETAAAMVAAGTWTDDARAAAFLGDDGAGALPLRVQFVDWLSGEAYQRRVDATVDALARHAGVSTAGSGDSVGESSVARTAGESALRTHESSALDSIEDASDSDADDRIEEDGIDASSIRSTADVGTFESATATDVSRSNGSANDDESTVAAPDAEATGLAEDALATNGGDDA